jgi:hypothetical protein
MTGIFTAINPQAFSVASSSWQEKQLSAYQCGKFPNNMVTLKKGKIVSLIN